jgi:hypothetical protein
MTAIGPTTDYPVLTALDAKADSTNPVIEYDCFYLADRIRSRSILR